jgi:transcriptional regulator GlxA family with amidase domain
MSQAAPRRIEVVVYPGFKALEAVGTMSVLEYANVHLVRRGRPRGYEITLASSAAGAVPSDMVMTLQATKAIDALDIPDIAVIVGHPDIDAALERNAALVGWLRSVAPKVDRLVALCSGSFFLAAAGLLEGKRAATHWSVASRMRSRFPGIDVDADAIYISGGKLWTSAGVTACLDLALALVEEDFGLDLALEVARDLVVYLKRPGGQSQFSVLLASQNTSHPGIRAVQDWILSNLHAALCIPDLARRAAMSERNFRRIFAKEVGTGPLLFIEMARLEAARRMLEGGRLSMKAIATRVGFGSEQSLRKLFLKHLSVTPHDYRARFGATRMGRKAMTVAS